MKRWRASLVAMVVATSVLPLAAASGSSRGTSGPTASSRHAAARHAHATPSTPTNVVVTAGDASATVSWDSPTGADGFVAMADPGGFSCQTANSSCVISGLANGTTYSVTVTASAAGLVSDASEPVSVTPQAGPPLAALGVSAFTIGTTATVSWLPVNSSTPITGYTVTSSPGGFTCSVTAVEGVVPTICVVTGLTSGQTYTFSVVATNTVGDSTPAMAPTVTPVDTPSAPTNVSTISTSATITVSWAPSASDGGSPILGYTALAFDPLTNSLVATCGAGASSTSCVMSALAPNTSYFVRVIAANAQGPSDPSLPTDPQSTAPTTPGSPVPTSLTPGNGTATVSWTAPANDGGATITSYTASADDGDGGIFTCEVDAAASSCMISGLTNGTHYTVIIAAHNVAGGSIAVSAGVVTPASVPTSPASINIAPASGAITVSWLAPTLNGGSAIYRYTATATDINGKTFTCITAGMSCVITSLINGVSYDITVVATNAVGDSLAADGGYATPSDVPGAPIPSSVTVGNGTLSVSWSAPLDSGGLPITGYTANATDSDGNTFSCTTDGSSCVIDGLTNGVSYDVMVIATNVDGDSSAAGFGSASPATTPTAPTTPLVVGSSHALSVAWSSSISNGGREIIGYTATATDGDGKVFTCSAAASDRSCAIYGLTNGTSYDITIVATNAVGDSVATDAGSYAPSDVPGAPVASSLTFGNASITASWFAPLDNGGLVISSYTVYATDGDGNTFTCTTDGTSCLIDGLVNGVSYVVTVVATNADGDSPQTAVGAITPATTPGSPISPVVTVANGSFTVNWAIPTVDGGSTIIGFTATATDFLGNTFSCVISGSGTSCLITGVSNGTSYDITVVATNAVGDSIAADAGYFIADTVPSVPMGGSLTAGNTSLTVSWSAPSTDGGSAITSYAATATDGNGNAFTCYSKGTSCDITGLTNGTSYAVIVVATNSVGDSVADSLGNATPVAAPRSPEVDFVTPSSGFISVAWVPSTDDGGREIIGYTATATDGDGKVFTCSAAASDRSCAIYGLTNGTSYDITIVATNAVGDSVATDAGSYAPSDVPGAPVASSLTFGNASITASWFAPLDNGGLVISSYTVYATDGDGNTFTCTTDGTSCLIDGLVNGVSYVVTVVATNADGDSPQTAVGAITPATTPGSPSDVSAIAGNGSVSVSWSGSADNGGSLIASYTATATDGDGNTFSCSTASDGNACVIYGLTNGTTYDIAVFATNSIGDSSTGDGGSILPSSIASAPTAGSVTSNDGSLTVSWSAPLDNGGLTITSYTATATDGDGNVFTCYSKGTSCDITGLTNGVSYVVTVVAVNGAGNSTPADLGTSTPAAVSSAPSNITVTASNGSLYVGWDYPTSDGGAYVTSYLVTATDQFGNSSTCIAGPGISSWWTACSVYGLTNGTSYDITVVAYNTAGASPSADAGYFVPATTPSAPIAVTATSSNQSLTVSWSLPDSDGGHAITSYTATATDSHGNSFSCTTDGTTCIIDGLTNGVSYDVVVVSTNDMGQSDVADAGPYMPSTNPSAPTNVSFSPDGSTFIISWSAPSDNGGLAIDSYTVTLNGEVVCVTSEISCSIDGFAAGTAYLLTVTATNAQGNSVSSEPLDLTDAAVVRSLLDRGVDRAGIVDTLTFVYKATANEAAQALLTGIGVPDGSLSSWLAPSGYTLVDIATAEHEVYGDNASQTYYAMRDWYGLSPEQWVSVLDGAHYSASDIAFTLHYALTVNASDAARALFATYVYGDVTATAILTGAGYSVFDVALMLRNVYGDSSSDAANAFSSGDGMGVNDISWALVASGAYGPGELAVALRVYFELSSADAAIVFNTVFGTNDSNAGSYLRDGGYSLGDVAYAMHFGFDDSAVGAFVAMRNWVSLSTSDWVSVLTDGQYSAAEIAYFLRNGYGANPQDATYALNQTFHFSDMDIASILTGAGYSMYDVALVLRNVYQDSPDVAASVLSGSLNLTVIQVAQAMKYSNAYGDTDVITAFRLYYELNSVDSAIAFNSAFGDSDTYTALYLYQAGYSLNDVAYGLHFGFNDSAWQAISAMRNWFGMSASEWVSVMDYAQYDATDIAYVLHYQFGIGPVDAAIAINQIFHFSDADLAPVLIGAAYSIYDVSYVLRNYYGDDATEAAIVLSVALELSVVDVGHAMVNSNAYSVSEFAYALRTYFELGSVDAALTINTAFGFSDTYTALYLYQGGYSLSDVAYALHFAYGDSAWQAMNSLRNWFGLSLSDWVSVMNDAQYDATDIAYALHYQFGIGPVDAAIALNQTFQFSDFDLAPVLVNAGYSTYDVAYVSRNYYGDTANQAASILQNSLELSDVQVAQAMVNSNAYGIYQFGNVLLTYYEYGSVEAATVLRVAFGTNDAGAALYLYQGGYSLSDIAYAMHFAFTDDAGQATNALRSWFNMPLSEWTSILNDAQYSATDITYILRAYFGSNWSDTANALIKIFGFTDTDLATVFASAGYSASDIANVLRWIYGDSASQSITVLETVLSLDAVYSGQAMVYSGAYSLADFVSALRAAFDFSSTDAASVLRQAFGFNDQQTAYDLYLGGYSVPDIAIAMKLTYDDAVGQTYLAVRNFVALSSSDVVAYLNDATYSVGDIAYVLRAYLGLNWSDAPYALNAIFAFDDYSMANILIGAGYSSSEVALSLRWVYDDSSSRAAEVMQKALTLNYIEIAQAMVFSGAYGIADFVYAVSNYFEYNAVDATTVIRNAFGFNDQQVAYYLYLGGYGLPDIAYALHISFNDAAWQDFLALNNVVSVSDADLVSMLDYAQYNASDIAYVLHYFYGDSAISATSALYRTFYSTDADMSLILKNAGYAPSETARVMLYVYEESADTAFAIVSDVYGTSTKDTVRALLDGGYVLSVPGAPTLVSASAGNGAIFVNWTASYEGGLSIQSFTATAVDGSGNRFFCTTSRSGNWCVITGLANGTNYAVTVVATNYVGDSANSDGSYATPATAPSAPSDVSARLSGTTLTVQWSASIDDGGSPITGYRAYADNGDGALSCATGPEATTCTISGLLVGQTYIVYVVAINAVDQSPATFIDAQFAPVSRPSAPAGVWTSSLDSGLQIYWNPPNDNGGLPISNYHIEVIDPSGDIVGTCDTLDTTCTVMGLTNWVTYTVLAKAENAQGSSDPLTTVPSGTNARDIVAYQTGWLALSGTMLQQSDPFFDLTTINSILGDNCTARTMAVAPDGSIWIQDYCGTYFRLNTDGSVDTFNPGAWSSYALAVAPNGDVLGTNWNSEISVFDPAANSWTTHWVDGAACLTGIAYTPDGSLYVADPCYWQVRQLTGDPTDPSSNLTVNDGPHIYVQDVMGLASAGDGTLVAGNDWWQTATVDPLSGIVNYAQSPLPCNDHLALVQGVIITADGCWSEFGVGGVSNTTGEPQSSTPSSPQNVVVHTGSHHIVVTWSPPQFNGTAGPTSSYSATASDGNGNTFQCSQSIYFACIIDGLTNGVTYDVTIVANNVAGSSSPVDAGLFQPVTASATMPADYQSAPPNSNTLLTSLSASGAAPTVSNLSDGATVLVSTSRGSLWMPNANGLTSLNNTPFTSGTTIGFSGSTESVNAALRSLQIYSQTTGVFTLTIQVIDAGFAYDPVSGHAFFQANCNNCSFTDAVTGANAFSVNGVGGYLVTDSTSSANDVLNRYMTQASFGGFTDYQPYLVDASGNALFAYQYANNDLSTSYDSSQYLSDPNASFQKWIYVSGPHRGEIMTFGGVRYGPCSAAPASAQNGFFANWAYGEPNDCGSNEFVPIIGSYASQWNDVGTQATLGSSVIEFGGLASDTGTLDIAHIASATGLVSPPPSQPDNVSAYENNQALVVTIGAPSDGGGNLVTYTYVASPTTWGNGDGVTCVTTSTTCSLDGLTWGESYYVTVYASTVAGNSSWAYVGYYAIAVEMSTQTDGNSTVLTVTSHDPSITSAWVNARSSGPTLRWCNFQSLEIGVSQSCPIHGLNYSTDYQMTVDTWAGSGAHVYAVAPVTTADYTSLYGFTPPSNFNTSWTDAQQTAAVDGNNNVWRLSANTEVEVDTMSGDVLASYNFGDLIPAGAYGARIAALPQGGVVVALNGYDSGGWMSLGAIIISASGDMTYVPGDATTVGQIAVDPITGNVAIDSGYGIALLNTITMTWSNTFPGTGSVDNRYDTVVFDSTGNLWFTGNNNSSVIYEVTDPFGDWALSETTPTVSISYRDQAMVSVNGLFYIVTSDNNIVVWDPSSNTSTSLNVYNEFPESAQWWGLYVPGIAGVVNGSVAFSVAEYGWNGGPGVAIFEMPLPTLS